MTAELERAYIRVINAALEIAQKDGSRQIEVCDIGHNKDLQRAWCRISGVINGDKNFVLVDNDIGGEQVFLCPM